MIQPSHQLNMVDLMHSKAYIIYALDARWGLVLPMTMVMVNSIYFITQSTMHLLGSCPYINDAHVLCMVTLSCHVSDTKMELREIIKKASTVVSQAPKLSLNLEVEVQFKAIVESSMAKTYRSIIITSSPCWILMTNRQTSTSSVVDSI